MSESKTEICDVCGKEYPNDMWQSWRIAPNHVENNRIFFCPDCWKSGNLPGGTTRTTYKIACVTCGKKCIAFHDPTPFERIRPGVFACHNGKCNERVIPPTAATAKTTPFNTIKSKRKALWPSRPTTWLSNS